MQPKEYSRTTVGCQDASLEVHRLFLQVPVLLDIPSEPESYLRILSSIHR
jgi:hypothetical protein